MSKKITPKYSPEVRERAVRRVQEHRGEYPSLWAAIESMAPKSGCVPQTLHEWVRKQEIDTGLRDGVTRDERERIKALEREVKELRRTNEVLKLASAFFTQAELDRRRATWKNREAVELATLEWVAWFNHHRLLEPIGSIPPAEAEANDYRQFAGNTLKAT